MEQEIWKPVVGYEGLYSISEYGKLRKEYSSKGKKIGIYPGYMTYKGYIAASLTKDRQRKMIFVHKLVCEAFIGVRPRGMQVNHKDANKMNNHFSNLEYVTLQQNKHHAFLHGLCKAPKGVLQHSAKLTEKQVISIRRQYAKGNISQATLAQRYKVNQTAIGFIIRRVHWKHI